MVKGLWHIAFHDFGADFGFVIFCVTNIHTYFSAAVLHIASFKVYGTNLDIIIISHMQSQFINV
jgi:hypothetical protein